EMTALAQKVTGFPRQRVMGQAGMLDTARFTHFVAEALAVPVSAVRTLTLGSHGDTMVPVPSRCTVNGRPLTDLLPKDKIDELVERARRGGAEGVALLKTGSAYFAPSAAAARMARAVAEDSGAVMPVCVAKANLFVYKGRGNAADATFVSGECAMITGSSALYGNVKRNAKFSHGTSTLPYYPDVQGAPQNTVIGGASLWVMSGKKPDEYKGVAAFFSYLSQPEVAAKSHQRTGYLPVTIPSYELTEKSGYYKQNPGTDVAVTQMIRKT